MTGVNTFEGDLNARNLRFGIAVSRFNAAITDSLLQGAMNTLRERGAAESDIQVVRVPGAFELPLVMQRMALTGQYDALIALGCVIRGGTPHFEYVCSACTHGLTEVALAFDMPVAFGILTTDNETQALDRAGGKEGNKGADAALTAIEMVHVLQHIGTTHE